MVKITLYNIGEYKKKQFLYCFVSFFYACCLCIPNILKESKKDIYLGTRILMLPILPLRELHFKAYHPATFYDIRFPILPLRELHFKAYHPATFYDIRFPIQHLLPTHHRVLWLRRVRLQKIFFMFMCIRETKMLLYIYTLYIGYIGT